MKFGAFIAPFHTRVNNPTLALERDIELVQALDRFGYDEAWIGEHHSGGTELICSPEIFIATLAERTRHIRLGTGVTSLSFYHPLTVAERLVLLDHLTRGRVMMGIGPGALASDAHQRGIDPRDQRRRMAESLEVIVKLLRGEYVTRESDWFSIVEGHLHMLPYQRPCFEIAVAALASPSGPELAGRFGCSLLSIGSTYIDSFEELGLHWQVYEDVCTKSGYVADRETWRLVGPVHIAATREEAFREVEYGIQSFIDYELYVCNLPLAADAKSPKEAARMMVETGAAVIGTPEDAIAQIDRLIGQTGGFGTFLHMITDWADPHARLRSLELFADEVMPHFQGTREPLQQSWDWAVNLKGELQPKAVEARLAAARAYFGADHERTRKLEELFGAAGPRQPAVQVSPTDANERRRSAALSAEDQ